MDIAFITPEITPYSRTTELGDVCAALPRALRGLGHRVTVISPLWADIDVTGRALARRLTAIDTKLVEGGSEYTVFDGRTTGGVDLVFLAQPERFGRMTSAAFALLPARDRMLSGLDFSIAAVDLLRQRDPKPELVHVHGYLAAAALPLLRERLPGVATVLSVYDLEERGRLEPGALQGVNLPDAIGEAAGARPSLLRAGLSTAGRVIVASTAEGQSLVGEQPELDGKLVVITPGVDSSRINPTSDALIPARYDAVELGGKARCKDALQYAAGLPVRADIPLIMCAGDFGAGRGKALLELLPAVLRNEAQVVLFGADPALSGLLAEISESYAERFKLLEASDERALHLAIAGADFALLPTRSSTLGDLHLCALRYGTLPIAALDGRVSETLVDCETALTTGNAFVSEAAELTAAAQRALAAYTRGELFDALRRRAMRTDVSWERSARRYEHAYKAITTR